MNSNDTWLQIFYSQVWVLPYLLMLIVCQCFALAYSRRYPTVSLLAFLGFGLWMLSVVFSTATTIWVLTSAPLDPTHQVFVALSQFSRMGLQVGGCVLLLMAIFGYRGPAEEKPKGKAHPFYPSKVEI
jgi:prepilin signal peptidase PulO-like enzyme (type II secretory pathway)